MAGKVKIDRKQPLKLPEKVAERFEATKGAKRITVSAWGHVDLNRVTIEMAEKLVKTGFPHLKEKGLKKVNK